MAIEDDSSLDFTTAFGLNAFAASATVLGGCIIFSNKLLQLASPMSMAVLLSVSGGIILFQALVVLFANSFEEFSDAFRKEESRSHSRAQDDDQGDAWLAATGCFGGGILITYVVDLSVQKLTPGQNLNGTARTQSDQISFQEGPVDVRPPVELVRNQGSDVFIKMDEAGKERLQRMGVQSAIAVGIHNVPAGIATFVASSDHAWMGLALAIGIALHNIAEGIAVAAPIYFATGSTCRALLWCFWSSIAQHTGGLIAFALMGTTDTAHPTQGLLYGLCAGLLAGISLKEIVPTAYMYANGRMHLVSAGTLGGMCLIATGLILFHYIRI